jgi:hypothetical protein
MPALACVEWPSGSSSTPRQVLGLRPAPEVGTTRYGGASEATGGIKATEVPVEQGAPIVATYRPLAGKVVEGS